MQGHADRATAGRVPQGIVDEVHEHLPQQVLVAGKRRVAVRLGPDRDVPRRGQHAAVVDDVVHEFVEIEVTDLEGPGRCVGQGEHEHVVDHPRQSSRLTRDDVEAFTVLALAACRLIEGDLGGGSNDRDGSAQLVRGFGHEGALLTHGRRQALEHPVERRRDAWPVRRPVGAA